MQAHKFKFLASEFITLLDSGNFDYIGPEIIKNHILAGSLRSFLMEQFGRDADLGVLDDNDWATLTHEWQRFVNDTFDQRLGIRNKGLCLLLSYTNRSQEARESDRKVA